MRNITLKITVTANVTYKEEDDTLDNLTIEENTADDILNEALTLSDLQLMSKTDDNFKIEVEVVKSD